MANFVATASDEKWSYDMLMRNTVCRVCNQMYFNNWFSCNRRAACVNTHPGLLGIRRQHLYMIKLFAKYQTNRHNITIPFEGHPGAKTTLEVYSITDQSLPKTKQHKYYIRHGMYMEHRYLFESKNYIFNF